MINLVLVEPEIPQNTGNIARTCSVTGASLHLIEPMGFKIDDKKLKRAGLDYWNTLNIFYYSSLPDFLEKHQGEEEKFYLTTTKGQAVYSDISYPEDVYLFFGKETAGLPVWFLKQNGDRCIRIPMGENQRSLNLSNTAAILTYEVLRQQNFEGLQKKGVFPK